MSRNPHTFGQTCHLSRSTSHKKPKPTDDEVPFLNSQYFYYANYSVDDPLSAIPITSGADSKSNQYPPLPFSARDNNALEEAWLGIRSSARRRAETSHTAEESGLKGRVNLGRGLVDDHEASKASKSKSLQEPELADGHMKYVDGGEKRGAMRPGTPVRHSKGFPSAGLSSGRTRGASGSADMTPAGSIGISTLLPQAQKQLKGDVVASHGRLDTQSIAELKSDVLGTATALVEIERSGKSAPGSTSGSMPSSLPVGSTGTTGRPFVKLPERSSSPRPMSRDQFEENADTLPTVYAGKRSHLRETTDNTIAEDHECKAFEDDTDHSDVPVGISRLYLVDLPSLLMKPIYWAHVHDTAPVIRATWFYKESMLPVEPAVANQLEIGYRELRPWSQTWQDELSSAVEVGASGEEKIAHRLWPKDDRHVSKQHQLSSYPQCAAKCFDGEASAEGSLEHTANTQEPKVVKKKYLSSQVIYKDVHTAFILKPTLQPSAYYGRKPLQKIRRGRGVGIEVIRGFDRSAWDKLHPPKRVTPPKVAAKVPVSGDAATAANADFCPACKASDETPNVTDLCLVIHGIGQKLSERVESFNFTHACNSVRRSVNVELGTDAVKKVLRRDLGGIMVLPVNWRSNLSFEDGGPRREGDMEDTSADFSLKDITPDTIPAVRNLISDVMLDIPFYMSHHKEKMISAVVREANRVYRLWCQNNPSFHGTGRVHVIAHSLGSPMTLEILSRQPTEIEDLDLSSDKMNLDHFDFNTTNLFCAGSPAAFFLLLQNGQLVPRRGRNKPGADFADDQDGAIVGEAGTFGCLAVDNIYNILHCNDPIAYRLNATVDPQYAASLKEAHVPSATTGFFEGIGNAMRNVTPGLAPSVDVAVGQVVKPGVLPRLPSQLEMEIHDFTREEIAEKKFYLLNDNCQIDWTLSSGGGPFDIAYLDMLGAHSSYWEKKEFIRLLVTEIGRAPGKRTTLPNMRAQKKTYKV